MSRKNQIIDAEINELQQRRNQSGTKDDEKEEIERRIKELEEKKKENARQMFAYGCQVMVIRFRNT